MTFTPKLGVPTKSEEKHEAMISNDCREELWKLLIADAGCINGPSVTRPIKREIACVYLGG